MSSRKLRGIVVSSGARHTAIVRVEKQELHPRYKKYIRRHKKYAVHDPNDICEIGQAVWIESIAPVSKTKSWIVLDTHKV